MKNFLFDRSLRYTQLVKIQANAFANLYSEFTAVCNKSCPDAKEGGRWRDSQKRILILWAWGFCSFMSCISSHLKDAFLCDNLWLPSKLDVPVVAHSGRRAKHFGMIVCLCLGAASRHFGQPTLDARLFSVDQIRRGIHGIWYIGQLKRSIKTCSLLAHWALFHRGGHDFLLVLQ